MGPATGVMSPRALAAAFVLFLALAAPAAAAVGKPNVAGLQVALRARGLYVGTIDGLAGRSTTTAVRRLQRRARIAVDGVAGPQTRAALGRYARHRFGARLLNMGKSGWDVAALQFALATHGFPSGTFDGGFGPHTDAALRRFQRFANLGADGVAGPATYAALRTPPARSPISLRRPVRAPLGDRFGPRDNRFHTGIDFTAPSGANVRAAASGRVVQAGWDSGGYGYLVTLWHGDGVRTMYAHLSAVLVHRGQRIAAGARLGRVGATGHAFGPHLHFEVRVRGAAVDPLPALR
ncbi:MAG TPA: peptidoglycan DD-metalloendopeptidase family protein [Gaiellaceae bacterium]|jgi:murein DD-endopeptidase MepM/ murein hydrolase activator NlpD|nr:peptidoglycan DD-metalloendopeptidase family protein [Gaiellaceae bacterium]